MNRFGLGCSKVGALLGFDHSTALYTRRIVRTMLEINNSDYVNCIIKWVEVFDSILPNGRNSVMIIQERLHQKLLELTEDRSEMVEALNNLQEKIANEIGECNPSGVI